MSKFDVWTDRVAEVVVLFAVGMGATVISRWFM